MTWLRFAVWMVIGILVYFLWSRKWSAVAQAREREAAGR